MSTTELAVQSRGELTGWEQGSAASGALVPTAAGAVAMVAREEAELKGAIVVAKQFQRDEVAAYNRIMKALERPRLASDATYKFPRGGQDVEGPSVDLAREMARVWGNIRYGLRQVTQTEEYVHIRGYALDLETNTYIEAEDYFRKKIQRKGGWKDPDERDLRELINRRGAILVRNCLLQLLPSDVVDDAVAKAKSTVKLAAAGQLERNRDDTLRRMVAAFDRLGVTTAMLSEKLGHDYKTMDAEEFSELTAIYKSMSEAHTRREEHFNVGTATTGSGHDLQERLRQQAQQQFTPDAEREASEHAADAKVADVESAPPARPRARSKVAEREPTDEELAEERAERAAREAMQDGDTLNLLEA